MWSQDDYGSNDNPLVLLIPNASCEFQHVLDCILMAFHDTDLPNLICKMNQSLMETDTTLQQAYSTFKKNVNPSLLKKAQKEKKRLIYNLFISLILLDGLREERNEISQHWKVYNPPTPSSIDG